MVASFKPALRVAEREVRFFRTSWRAVAFTTFVGPVLFLVALGLGLGGLVSEPESFGELSFLAFIAPGMMVGAAAQMAAGSGLWPIMAGHRWIGFHRAMVATPIAVRDVVIGWLLWVGGRTAVQATVFLVVAALLGGIVSPWAPLAVLVAVLTGVTFTAVLMAWTASQDTDGTFDPIVRVVVAPLYLFSGAFFPTESLPVGLQWVVRIFPMWHGIELGRLAAAGHPSEWPPLVHLLVLLVWLTVGVTASMVTFARRLTP